VTTDQETKASRQAKRKLAQALGKLVALALIILMVLLIERYCTVEAPPFGPDAKLVSVDGDTIRAANGAEYRIYGIDAPELHQSCTEAHGKAWLCGRAAKAKLTTMLNRGNVNCETRATDRFGRTVAVCSAEGVPDIGEALVREGYAVDLAPSHPYRDAEADAREAKRGIWRGSFQLPWEWRAANPREGD
jgi:endonuclease YncB( thermonuclease family)